MATNPYFSQGTKSEKDLYEDLIIESLQIYGQDVYYIPRDLVNVDTIFYDDIPSRFNSAYKIEMYLENTDGCLGEGDLFTKFGIEIRDTANLIVSRRRWERAVMRYDNEITTVRPAEGDLIYIALSGSLFEITHVEHEYTFYQLQNITTYRLTCQLFEYNDEQLNTGIDGIDNLEQTGYMVELLLSDSAGSYQIGEAVTQTFPSGVVVNGEVLYWNDKDNIIKLGHVGSNSSTYHTFGNGRIVGQTSGASKRIVSKVEDLSGVNDQNDDFKTEGIDFIDFTELNPFGDPER